MFPELVRVPLNEVSRWTHGFHAAATYMLLFDGS